MFFYLCYCCYVLMYLIKHLKLVMFNCVLCLSYFFRFVNFTNKVSLSGLNTISGTRLILSGVSTGSRIKFLTIPESTAFSSSIANRWPVKKFNMKILVMRGILFYYKNFEISVNILYLINRLSLQELHRLIVGKVFLKTNWKFDSVLKLIA